ncbi:MAG: hypothetical protein M3Y54_09435 [Bacteroidota bacterium]|nr:hypothetical protein [Bacteroidota bacterium]
MLKSITLTTALMLACATASVRAQMADRLTEHPTVQQSPSEQALALTREMTNRLHLNEGQFLKLLPLNRTRLDELNSINLTYRSDEATRAAKATELEAQFEQECSRILTPSQLSQLHNNFSTPPAATSTGLG